jgi:hypothetical protein
MINSGLTRRIALCVGAVAIAGMGLTVGCSTKQSPAPTDSTQNSIDSKAPTAKTPGGNSFAPSVNAPPAVTALPGNVNTGPAR